MSGLWYNTLKAIIRVLENYADKPEPSKLKAGDVVSTKNLKFKVDEGRHQIDLVIIIRKLNGE
jgi:hypothetical protein